MRKITSLLAGAAMVALPLGGITAVAVIAPTAASASTCVNNTSIYDDEMGAYLQAASAAAGSTPIDGVRDQGTSGATYSEWDVCQDPSDSGLYSIQNVGTGDYVNDSEGNAVVANSGTQGYNWEINCDSSVSDATFDSRAQIDEAVDNSGTPLPTGYTWVGYGTENVVGGYAFGVKLVEPSNIIDGDSVAIAGMCGADTSDTLTCLSGTIHITPDDTNFFIGSGVVQWTGTLAEAHSYTPCQDSTTGEWEIKDGTSYLTWASRASGMTETSTAIKQFDFAECGSGYFRLETGADRAYSAYNVYGMLPAYDSASGGTNTDVIAGSGGSSTVFSSYTGTSYTTGATSGVTICGYY